MGGPYPDAYRPALPLANIVAPRALKRITGASKRAPAEHDTICATLYGKRYYLRIRREARAADGFALPSAEGDSGLVRDDEPRAKRTFNPGNGDFHLGEFAPRPSNLSAKTARLRGQVCHLCFQRVEFVLNAVEARMMRLPVFRQLLAEIAADMSSVCRRISSRSLSNSPASSVRSVSP